MKAWKYEKGEWSIIDGDIEDSGIDDDNNFYVDDRTYYQLERIGKKDDINSVDIFYRLSEPIIQNFPKETAEYVIDFCIGGFSWLVFIFNLPDLMDWLAKYSPYFMARDWMNHPYRR